MSCSLFLICYDFWRTLVNFNYILCTPYVLLLELCAFLPYRSLSRRLDRCDRLIQNESSGTFGGNVDKLHSLRANSGMCNVICIVT